MIVQLYHPASAELQMVDMLLLPLYFTNGMRFSNGPFLHTCNAACSSWTIHPYVHQSTHFPSKIVECEGGTWQTSTAQTVFLSLFSEQRLLHGLLLWTSRLQCFVKGHFMNRDGSNDSFKSLAATLWFFFALLSILYCYFRLTLAGSLLLRRAAPLLNHVHLTVSLTKD